MGSIKLSIIIVNWNTCELLRQCLSSVCVSHMLVTYEIIVVDNASSDDSVDMLKTNFPEVKIIQNSDNAGFARANNQAIEYVKGEYVLLLNSDTIVQDVMVFTKWLDFMDKNSNVGSSGCKLIFQNKMHQVGDAGYKPTWITVFFHAFFFSKFFPNLCNGIFLTADNYHTIQYVDWICGAALLIRKSILKDIGGGLDEQNFMYAEDIEFGCRVRNNGYKVAYIPSIQIIHLQGGSDKDNGINLSATWLINLRRLYRQFNSNIISLFFFNIVMGTGFLLRFLIYKISGIILSDKTMLNKSKQMLYYTKNCFFNLTGV